MIKRRTTATTPKAVAAMSPDASSSHPHARTVQAQDIADYLVAHAPWLKPFMVAAIIGAFTVESGLNPHAQGDTNLVDHAHGLGQWRGRRWNALRNLARAQNVDPADWKLQLDYLLGELTTTEKYAGLHLRQAYDLPGAVDALVDYERPGGWRVGHPREAYSWHARFDAAHRVLAQLIKETTNA